MQIGIPVPAEFPDMLDFSSSRASPSRSILRFRLWLGRDSVLRFGVLTVGAELFVIALDVGNRGVLPRGGRAIY